jgi:hypothetical protein
MIDKIVRASAAVVVGAVLLACAATADAVTLTVEPGGAITSVSLGKVSFESPEGGGLNIRCNLRMTGTLTAAPIAAVAGTQFGSITSAATEACEGNGEARVLEGSLPWALIYNRHAIEVNLDGLLFTIREAAVLVRDMIAGFIAGCLYKGNANALLAWTAENPHRSGLITSLANNIAFFLKLAGSEFECVNNARVIGTFSLTPQQRIREEP